jgi:ectoine hydroxylase-related dioxygenase (phytanoyl-CoA dioxygenase family)
MPGDVFIFSGYLPHRSATNKSNFARRALFLTYNRKSEGDFHTDYYAAKHSGREGFDPTKAISFQGDFQGKLVE